MTTFCRPGVITIERLDVPALLKSLSKGDWHQTKPHDLHHWTDQSGRTAWLIQHDEELIIEVYRGDTLLFAGTLSSQALAGYYQPLN